MGKKHVKEYQIHLYESDQRLKCTMESIVNFIQDVGTEQSEKLGGGMEYLIERNMGWVFYQYDVSVKRYPSYGETIKVETEPYGFNKFYGVRRYDMYDENGEKIVEAKAVFLLINLEKRRTMRIPEDQYSMYGVDISEKLDFRIEKIEKLKDAMYTRQFDIRYSDIDFNRHVNNSKYVQWAIESVPLEILNNYELAQIKVNFEKECTYGEKICVSASTINTESENITTIHKIEDSTGKVLTNLIGVWRKIS